VHAGERAERVFPSSISFATRRNGTVIRWSRSKSTSAWATARPSVSTTTRGKRPSTATTARLSGSGTRARSSFIATSGNRVDGGKGRYP
jgi:hypothetical protein